MQVVCPHCSTINRVPAERPRLEARCGRCKSVLFPGQPVELDSASLDRQITRSELPLLVDCWAPWCAPCRQMAPVYAKAAERLASRVLLGKLDTEAHPDAASRLGIRSIPTLISFRDGHERARTAGAMDLGTLLAWTEQQLA
jgi:thioredoxin 2